MIRPSPRAPVILGAADGVTIVLGLLVSLTAHPSAVFRAALGAGLAELVGMTAGVWLSAGQDGTGHGGGWRGFWAALSCGGAALVACAAPAVPYLVAHGPVALGASVALTAAVAGIVAWLRPEKGILAVAQTYGVLAVAAGLCYGASLV